MTRSKMFVLSVVVLVVGFAGLFAIIALIRAAAASLGIAWEDGRSILGVFFAVILLAGAWTYEWGRQRGDGKRKNEAADTESSEVNLAYRLDDDGELVPLETLEADEARRKRVT